MASLKQIIESNGLSFSEAARIIGCDKSQVVKVSNHTYPHWEEKEPEFIAKLNSAGCTAIAPQGFKIDPDVLVCTPSVSNFQLLADSLSDPEGRLSSSIGMVIGTAERGKSFTSRWYVQNNPLAAYVLYVDGSTKYQLLGDICEAVAHTRPHSFAACISVLEETCRYNRRLVIIDEADKIPVRQLEILRAVNERARLPFLIVGEEGLKVKTDRIPRLRSRIRNPLVVFEPAQAVDVLAYYQTAAQLQIDRRTAERLARHADGGFRTIVNDADALSKMSAASGIDMITDSMLDRLGA